MHCGLCICAFVPRIETKTRLLLVIHRLEARKTTNTGRLAAMCLPNSEVLVRGNEGAPSALGPELLSNAVLLFPHEDAIPIEKLASPPATLIVPDGTWRQASKVRQRIPGLHAIPCVSLPRDAPSVYRLRAEAHGHGLATIEAVARAMGVLEGPHVRRALEHVLRVMVERTLWVRGGLSAENVTGGIPPGAKRHDPRSGLSG